MKDHDGHGCDAIGRRASLLCAGLGIIVAAATISFMNLGPIFGEYYVLVGLVALFFASAFLGSKAGTVLCEKGNRLGLNLVVGVGVALGSVAAAVLAGSISNVLFGGLNNASDFWIVLLAPQLFVFMFGGIPAIALGILYGGIVGKRLSKLNQQGGSL